MKKKLLPFEDDWTFAVAGTRDVANVAGEQVHNDDVPANDMLWTDDGDPFPLAAQTVTTITTSAAKPVASIATLADYLINGFWQYNGTTAHHWASNTITYNINGLNSSEQFLALTAMQAWHEVANVNFVQTSGPANITFTHNGTMQAYASGSWNGSGAITSMVVNISTDWVTTDGGAYDGKTGIDSYAYQTYVHEIGHALGLGHQGPYNGSASYSTNALYANDTWQYSIMSYFSEPNYSGSSYRYVVTPQMADIYAVAAIYGAATTTRTGDTVYGFNSNAGAVFSFGNYASAPALTIYDSGGNDTLDCSGYASAQIIDLHSGAFSSVGGLVNNIGIALSAIIEKVIGGSGNDMLTANDVDCTLSGSGGIDTLIGGAGSDRLIGGLGADALTGGGGSDTFVFQLGDGPANGQHDCVTDFLSGLDRIDLSSIDAISGTGSYDQFRFIATTAFSGAAGELNFFYNSSNSVTTLQGDSNGDGIADFAIDFTGNVLFSVTDFVGAYAGPLVIEGFGSTSIVDVGGKYFLQAVLGSSEPTLKLNGVAVTSGQFGAWTPIGAEQTAGGYQVAWKYAGADQYLVWATDTNGNFISNVIGVSSGSSTSLKSLEISFQQDLNGDGVIGVPTTVIESDGSTSLVALGSNFLLGGAGPTLKLNGVAVTSGQFGGWTPIGTEQAVGGYQVAWKNAGADQYLVWATDTNGTFTSNVVGVSSGSSTALKSLETGFQQDLNGDGVIGVPTTVIESNGSTSLVALGGNFLLGGAGPTLKLNGVAVTSGQFGGWTPIGTEQAAGGYQVAWKYAGADQYLVWATDTNGTFTSNVVGVSSGSSAALKSLETGFLQDLNGDGVIGVPTTVIESYGSTNLVAVDGNFFLGGAGPALKLNGIAVTSGQFGAWTPIGTEQTTGGYQVAWKYAGADQYLVWATDTNGNFTSNVIGVSSGSSTALESLETSFHQDLSGDGVIGVPPANTPAASLPASAFEFSPIDSFSFAQRPGESSSTKEADLVASNDMLGSVFHEFAGQRLGSSFDATHESQIHPIALHNQLQSDMLSSSYLLIH